MPTSSRARRWPWLPGGAFARGVLTLASGTALAQALLALAVPVLARLYTPADYGVLAVYASTLTVLVVLASLRYEVAIPLPDDDRAAGAVLALAFLVLTVTTVLVVVAVWLGGDAFVGALKVPSLRPYLWLVPLGFAGAGAYQALSYWAIRRRHFARLSRTRVSQGIGQVLTQAGLGLAGAGAPGLLIGDVIGRVAGGGSLALQAFRDHPMAGVTRRHLREAAARYRRFPLLTTWSGLFNVGSLQLPSIVLAASFGAAAAGLYAVSYKILVLPTMLVGQAVGQVFLSRAATLAREPDRLRQLSERTALVLFAGGLPVYSVIALAGPGLFGLLLGREWEASGRYAQILAPWFAVWLVSSPLSGLLTVREWQGTALAFGGFEFILRLGALLAGAARGSPLLAIVLLSASGVIISLASIARFLHAGHSSIARLVGPAVRLLTLVAACLLPGVLTFQAGNPRLALLAGLAGVAAYYAIVLRSDAASAILGLRVRPSEAVP